MDICKAILHAPNSPLLSKDAIIVMNNIKYKILSYINTIIWLIKSFYYLNIRTSI